MQKQKKNFAIVLIALTIILLFAAWKFNYGSSSASDMTEKTRAYTREREFNYVSWTLDAVLLKLQSDAISAPYVFDSKTQKKLVMEWLSLTQEILQKEYELEEIYADPQIEDKLAASQSVRAELARLQARLNSVSPLAESVLQGQVAFILAEEGLTTMGQPLPSVWYHVTPLPLALIISPRERIEQSVNISLQADITVDEQSALEERVDDGLNVSSLVVPVGGVGVYPTMVMRSTNLNWLTATIAHEWIHNYLTLRPLGMRYEKLRTMNETTASIAGDEIGAKLIARFYPELAATPRPFSAAYPPGFITPASLSLYEGFDFNEAMRETRVQTDVLLSLEKIEEAEQYMEERRLLFLQNGYTLRKINQAYFAFYGAYADAPGGAAGEDPVGPAVRALRARSSSLADFVKTMSRMKSFEDLQDAVQFQLYLTRLDKK